MKRITVLSAIILSIIGIPEASAFTCFLTLVKNSCWVDYNVNVDVTDASTSKSILTGTVLKGKLWSRTKFACEAGQAFNYTATFSPIIWESDKGKHYPGKSTWSLPAEIKKGDTAWNITVCYPEEFSEVPYPITNVTKCVCNNQNLPPVPAPEKP